jgi:DNA-nicking Smr family endonuclease
MSNDNRNNKQRNRSDDSDLESFRKFCKSVKPLKQDNKVTRQASPPSKTMTNTHNHTQLSEPNKITHQYSINTLEKVGSDTILHYNQPHLHRKLLRQMKRGTFSIEATLDLHQCTVDETLHRATQFLDASCEQGFRWVLIVHGKGRLSKQGIPVLKSFLNHWLKDNPCVLAFHSAQPKHGGSGALYVLLKSKKR